MTETILCDEMSIRVYVCVCACAQQLQVIMEVKTEVPESHLTAFSAQWCKVQGATLTNFL